MAQADGRVEARILVPRGLGLWPACWMLGADIDSAGWPRSGEIDIMEHIGREPAIVHGTLHVPGYSGADGIGRWCVEEDCHGEGLPVSVPCARATECTAPAERTGTGGYCHHQTEYPPLLVRSVCFVHSFPTSPTRKPEDPLLLLLNVAVGEAGRAVRTRRRRSRSRWWWTMDARTANRSVSHSLVA